jgi:two-component system nitrate/nitrite response regulator NarL
MRVLLVDDHELVWNGTRRLLEDVVRSAATSSCEPVDRQFSFQAVRDVESACGLLDERFDVILLDYHLPDLSGLAALKRLQAVFEESIICILSAESGRRQIMEVLEAGAAGFIPKAYRGPEMADALRLVLQQKIYVPAEFLFSQEVVRGGEVDEVENDDVAAFLRNELSKRQREVLSLALRGLPNKTIARQLSIAEGTVKVHLSMVYRALGVKNRVGALCRVLQANAAGALE